jgi:sulfopropanediol 3-dehydrogenase
MQYVKHALSRSEDDDDAINDKVIAILSHVRRDGESAVREYAKSLDNWEGEFVLSEGKKASLIAEVSDREKADICFAHRQIVRFAEAQKNSLHEFAIESEPGVRLGQRIVPIDSAGCYVPGGRYAHIASAIMSIATAKVAGVPFVVAASPPRGESIAPAVVYAMELSGADLILQMGGVQAVASMAFGLFGAKPVDMLVGPGNAYVAQAKRLLFGEIGIDVFAGPTESAIIADETADPMTIAIDLASQAEHGNNSPVLLLTTSRGLAEAIGEILANVATDMPSGDVVMSAWHNYGEVIFCETREEAAEVSDRYAYEHVQVIARELDWWKSRLRNYGSLFLGEGSTVTHGDKCSGTNHILPTRRAARHTGGLNVMRFLKVLTWQEISEEANLVFSAIASRISRLEGMDGHARACDWRLRKYFPEKNWDFDVSSQRRYG